MEHSERRTRIRANLGIEPISHGQVHTFQLAIPEPEKKDIPPERHQILEDSFTEHKSNLVPLIVRRTEKYSEEEEYEVVYGADWCIVAKELDIEKLWVWVFDMTDEQAAAAKAEMEQLAGVTGSLTIDRLPVSDETQQIKILLQQFEKSFQQQFKVLTDKVEQVAESTKQLENFMTQLLNDTSLKNNKKKIQPKNDDKRTVKQLKEIAKKQGIKGYSGMNKTQLIAALELRGEK